MAKSAMLMQKPLSNFRKLQFKFWQLAEPRAVFEWQSFYALRWAMKRLPKGDGHPVVVFPGFASSDRATKPMRGLLNDLGYQSHGWNLGQNLLFDAQLEAEMVAMIREIHQKEGRKVSLIGWSLGGLYAREVAKACPEAVRLVISLGSPISGVGGHSNAKKLFRAINGKPDDLEYAMYQSLNTPPPVPTTSIYSKTDGIVAWEGSVQKRSTCDSETQTENIEVPASHLGLGVNPLVMNVIADRLAQVEGKWQPFKRKHLLRLIYKKPSKKHVELA